MPETSANYTTGGGQRHSTRLKPSRCRASYGIHILRQRHSTRLKLKHGLSARVRKRTRLRNGSTAAEMLYSTPGKAVPHRPLDSRYRHSSPAARRHDAAIQKYHINQRQHITLSTRQQTHSSPTARQRPAAPPTRHHGSPAPRQPSTDSTAPYPEQKTGTAKHRRPGHIDSDSPTSSPSRR